MINLDKRFFKGEWLEAYQLFGAHKTNNGFSFCVYAPNAKEVELVGDFNNWEGHNHKMKRIHSSGIYHLEVEGIKEYCQYKYHILAQNNRWLFKADPYAFFSQIRPNNASMTFDINNYQFNDFEWMENRNKCHDRPLNIFELHLGSWIKKEDGSTYNYEEIAEKIILYVKKNNFTHVEIMPLTEYPFDGSWGYQCSGYFAITSRYGNPNQFKYLVDKLHQANIGVILDYVILHFVKDQFGLIKFDGSYLYESYYKHLRYSPWDTYLFDFSKPMVMSFILSSLNYLISYYHLDGIRFDAISNMIYLQGNKNLGENSSGINFLKKMNHTLAQVHPQVMLIAEDSSDYQKVTIPTFEGGLGFDYKWDLGWMNDTLKYLSIDPLFRGDHLNKINFSMYYFYSEKFLLPFSHDEVVHMKGTIINKIWGNYEQKFAQLKTLYTYMFTHPGKKLNFMGNELALFDEWNENKSIDFSILRFPIHDSFNHYFKDLSALYKKEKSLFMDEYNPNHFEWILCNDNQNVFIYKRKYKKQELIIVLNFSGNNFEHFKFNVNKSSGKYKEILNSDAYPYHGKNKINNYDIEINNQSIGIKIPEFGALIIKYYK